MRLLSPINEAKDIPTQDTVVVPVVHGATAGTTRPTGAAVVHWIGSVEPTNATNNDLWTDTDAAAGGSSARASVLYTTASLAHNAAETGTVTMAKSYKLIRVVTDRAARVQVYSTAALRTADASRNTSTDPDITTNHGVVLDLVTSSGVLDFYLSPQVDGSNFESTPSSAIPIRVTNISGATSTVAVTFHFIALES